MEPCKDCIKRNGIMFYCLYCAPKQQSFPYLEQVKCSCGKNLYLFCSDPNWFCVRFFCKQCELDRSFYRTYYAAKRRLDRDMFLLRTIHSKCPKKVRAHLEDDLYKLIKSHPLIKSIKN